MDDAYDQPEERPPAPKMSHTPSWVTLGFLLGAATVWSYLTHQEKIAPPAPVTLNAWPVQKRAEPNPLTTVEAIFITYLDRAEEYGIWDNNTTEIAVWNAAKREFSDFYEVRKLGGNLYFRSIPALTRVIIARGRLLANELPLRFTESEEKYKEWLEHGRFERSEEASLQPTLLGPTVIPAGETPPPKPKPAKMKMAIPPEAITPPPVEVQRVNPKE